ncbi:hypothetical protein MASR1M101_27710 [Gemmatimonas sp.]
MQHASGAGYLAPHRLFGGPQLLEDLARSREQRLASHCKRDATPMPLKERDPQLLLQALDLHGQRWLRKPQLAGGAAERAGIRRFEEGAEKGAIHMSYS